MTAGVCRDDGAEVGFGASWARTLVSIWTMEEAREGAGRRQIKEKEIRRTLAMQRKDTRKKSFASRVQDPWKCSKNWPLADSFSKSRYQFVYIYVPFPCFFKHFIGPEIT